MTITVTLVFHNELEFLPGWFKAVSQYADQVVMAAHNPTDGSLEWALKTKAEASIPIEIIQFPEDTVFNHGFSYMKNECIKLANQDWIVSLDADEEMEINKEKLKPWMATNPLAISTVTMHTTECKPHWSLDNRDLIRQEANWIRQRHWRIFKNHKGIHWKGLIHEELRSASNIHISRISRQSTYPMWHFGSMANPLKRTFKDGLYAELLLRIVEQPELREGTNSWWYTKYYDEHKDKLLKDRAEYRQSRGIG